MALQSVDVTGMSYFTGSVKDPLESSSLPVVLHICVEHHADHTHTAVLRTASALSGVVARSAGCVDGRILMNSAPCTPEAYIGLWRETLRVSEKQTIQAWLDSYAVTTTVELPKPGRQHATWLSPIFKHARERLFGAQSGPGCIAQLHTPAEILIAAHVIRGLTAFGLDAPTLTQTLEVKQQHNRMQLAAA